ncbi:MAG: hypothetical protein R6W88_08870 [Desulfobacterales bacterium]
MKRPDLNEINLDEVMNNLFSGKPCVLMTMSRGQWDGLLATAYESGHVLIELDRNETPVKAYQRAMN